MLVFDESKQAQRADETRYELQREQYKNWVASQLEHYIFVDDNRVNITDANQQMGRVYLPADFEAKCRKIIPTLWTCVNPHNSAMRAMYYNTPPKDAKGNPTFTDLIISPYPNGPLPEWSIWSYKIDERPDPSIWGHEGRKNPIETATDGWIKTKIPDMEIYRGWRTVLCHMVARGHATPTVIEREFGIGDRLSWATHMGRREGSPF